MLKKIFDLTKNYNILFLLFFSPRSIANGKPLLLVWEFTLQFGHTT
jgi:hypothetical protein